VEGRITTGCPARAAAAPRCLLNDGVAPSAIAVKAAASPRVPTVTTRLARLILASAASRSAPARRRSPILITLDRTIGISVRSVIRP
jgi:hypothetical protein